MPYPNEHACRVLDPDQFVKFIRKTVTDNQDTDDYQSTGLDYDLIIGYREDKSSDVQAHRYPKAKWSEAQARKHCKTHGGKTFEPAKADSYQGDTMKPLFYLRAYPVRQGDETDQNAPIRFVASTEGRKADGIDLKTADWLLGRYEKHPVVLYAHDYFGSHLPLGSGKPTIDGSRLLIDVTFDIEDEFARAVRAKTVKGLMAGSVGWQTIDQGNELLEFSIVPVPLDPDALPMRQAAGRRALQDWLDEIAIGDDPNDDNQDVDDLQLDNQSRGARIGAVLSARNLRDLEEAVNLVNGVIERSKKADDKDGDDAPDGDDERSLSALLDIQTKLKSISGA